MSDADGPVDLSVRPSVGLVSGVTIQFIEGNPMDPEVAGVVITEEAFDLIEPVITGDPPFLSFIDRYGVTPLPSPMMRGAIQRLREAAASRSQTDAQRELFHGLADYLDSVVNRALTVTVCGY